MLEKCRPVLLAVLGAVEFGGALSGQAGPPLPAGTRVVQIVTHEFAFAMPDSLPAGLTTFRLRNEGQQPHHLMLYRVEPGKSLADVLSLSKPAEHTRPGCKQSEAPTQCLMGAWLSGRCCCCRAAMSPSAM